LVHRPGRLRKTFVTLCLCGGLAATQAFAGPISVKVKPPHGGGVGNSAPVCAAPACLDLTTRGAAGVAAGALFKQIDPQPTGTGHIDPFLRLQSSGVATTTEGYNTSARPFEFDEKNPLGFTHDLLLSDVGVFAIEGVEYREFLLDINESSGRDRETVSLDRLMIFEAPAGGRTGFPFLGTLVYDLDAGGIDRWIKLDYSLNHGSGSGDMASYVRADLFTGLDYVYLYSRFGDHHAVDAGFEEWWTRDGAAAASVPEPSLMLMLGAGFAAVMARRRIRRD
jgi:hypothetical protein